MTAICPAWLRETASWQWFVRMEVKKRAGNVAKNPVYRRKMKLEIQTLVPPDTGLVIPTRTYK
jgi:hypothetical protein